MASKAGSKSLADVSLNAKGQDSRTATTPTRLAANIVGTSDHTIQRVDYVIEPEKAEAEIHAAHVASHISTERRNELLKQLHDTRKKLERGEVGAMPAEKAIKTAIQTGIDSNTGSSGSGRGVERKRRAPSIVKFSVA